MERQDLLTSMMAHKSRQSRISVNSILFKLLPMVTIKENKYIFIWMEKKMENKAKK